MKQDGWDSPVQPFLSEKSRRMMDRELYDRQRIRHLFKIGIFAALLVLAGDILLGWGTVNENLTGMDRYFSRYLSVSETRIALSSFLGLIGIPVECLSYFGIYRLISVRSEKYAHTYRAGLIGMTAFGALVHVLCCIVIWFFNHLYAMDPGTAADLTVKTALMFLMPAMVIFMVFFFLTAAVQFQTFRKRLTPYAEYCRFFSILSGIPVIIVMRFFGNNAFAYALSTGWISIGSIITFTGLLVMSRKAEKQEGVRV